MAPSIAADLIMAHLISGEEGGGGIFADIARAAAHSLPPVVDAPSEQEKLSALDYVQDQLRRANFDASDSGSEVGYLGSGNRGAPAYSSSGSRGRPAAGPSGGPYDDEYDARVDFLVRIYGLVRR